MDWRQILRKLKKKKEYEEKKEKIWRLQDFLEATRTKESNG